MLEVNNTFTRKVRNGSAIVNFLDKDNYEALKIEIHDETMFSSFKMIIDNEYIQNKDPHFANYFGSVGRLYHYLEQHFDSLCFTDDGDILIEIQVMIQGQNERKTYRLQMLREHTNQIQQIVREIQKIREQALEKNQRAERQIESLKQIQKLKQNQTQRSIDYLQGEIRRVDNRISQETEAAQNNLQRLSKELKQNDQKIEAIKTETLNFITERLSNTQENIEEIKCEQIKLRKEISVINPAIEDQQSQFSQMEQLIYKLENLRTARFSSIMMHPLNPHSNSFLIEEELDSIKIYRQGLRGKYNNYIAKDQLAVDRISTIRLKQVKTSNKDIMLGLGSTDAFEQENAFNFSSALSYYSHGYVFNSGRWSQTHLAVQDGMIISMKVDLKAFVVSWFIEDVLAATVVINAELRSKALFPIIMMMHTGDEVQILL